MGMAPCKKQGCVFARWVQRGLDGKGIGRQIVKRPAKGQSAVAGFCSRRGKGLEQSEEQLHQHFSSTSPPGHVLRSDRLSYTVNICIIHQYSPFESPGFHYSDFETESCHFTAVAFFFQSKIICHFLPTNLFST